LQQKIAGVDDTANEKLKTELTAGQLRALEKQRGQANPFMRGRSGDKQPETKQGRSAFVFVDQRTGEPKVFDFVNITPRSAGYKVHFHKDQTLKSMTSINLIFEYNDRFVLAEPLAYEVYRRAGNAAELTDFVRLWIDGELAGYHLLIEQPNRSFLKRNQIHENGNMYKILWYERGVIGQHEKKSNLRSGHDDIVQLVDLLEKTKSNSDEQWAVIQKHFNVPQVINYFAINMCLSHWDGFFNNYFTYHDIEGSGKWEMYPWDQDKTWGFHDGLSEGQDFYDMPLTFGMEGDRPPGWPKDRKPPRGVAHAWWRPGGYFSSPLLTNPHFRSLFLARTKEILETIYTEDVFFPIINEMGDRLKEEVRIRATALKQDPDQASEKLQRNLQSLRDHLTKRRKFLLEQPEIRNAGKSQRAEIK
jgi:spore coat protein CotH